MCALVTGVQTCALPICNPIVVINPLRERGLERFQNPQSPVEMVTLQDTQIASAYHLVKVGGDVALLKGIMKALLEADRSAERRVGKECVRTSRSSAWQYTSQKNTR